MEFHCPIDRKVLSANDASLRCPDGHSFDRAKEGYYNLLLVQQKASLDPGDNKEMVEARRRFLAGGHFAPLAEKLVEFSRRLTAGIQSPRILDAGCGEGYYLGRVLEAIPSADLSGIDISKWAVKAAAKSHKKIGWAVASSKQLPFAKKSQDLILCLFGFPFWESFRSALADTGHLLLVDPAPEHLWELRELIYDSVKSTDLSKIDGALAAGFSLVSEETLTFSIKLETSAAIQDLLAMTPHGYRITAEARERLGRVRDLTTKVSVAFRVLKLSQGG
ncbi:MAG: putative RNA methyltransferase [Bdellovibrionota bacterium]